MVKHHSLELYEMAYDYAVKAYIKIGLRLIISQSYLSLVTSTQYRVSTIFRFSYFI